jgi:hypothetical protein
MAHLTSLLHAAALPAVIYESSEDLMDKMEAKDEEPYNSISIPSH